MGKRAATLLIASAVGFAAPISLYAAGSRYLEPTTAADAMPSYEVLTRVRSLALDPIGQPLRRGPYYILHAYDRRGTEMRVVADAHFGDVISVTPATMLTAPGPGTVGGARIIHVPAPGEDEASVAPEAEPEIDEPAPRPAPKAKPQRMPAAKHISKREPEVRRRPFSVEPPAPPPPPPPAAERRAILTAPPPPPAPLDDGPTPLRPTPRFGAPGQSATVVIPPAPPVSEPPPADLPPAQD